MSGTLGVTGVRTATGGIELSHATANTLTASSGVLSIEGNRVFHACGTDIPVADGGTGASTFTANGILVGNGTSAVAVTATMATKGHVMIGDGSGVPSMLAVGTNCHVLTACSSEATGVKWAAAGASDISSRVYTNAAQSISNACDNLVLWQLESYDTDSMHGTNTCQSAADASSKLTAKTAGKYHISVGIEFAVNVTGFRGGYIREGGDTVISTVRQTSVCGTGKPQFQFSTDYDLGACDYVQVLVAQNSGGSLDLSNSAGLTWFAMHKIN